MNKKIGIALAVLIGILISYVLVSYNKKTPVENPTPTPSVSSTTPSTATENTITPTPIKTPESYTLAMVKTHYTPTSCWTAVDGTVYDITNWIHKHPGGSGAIMRLCGTDGSDAFNGKHGGQARPTSELATFKIGILTK